MYPLKFEPIYKEKVWGGSSLKHCLNKQIPENALIGESWEVCAHQSGTSVVQNGHYRGKSLIDLLKNNREEIFGKIALSGKDTFPLLIKFIDAKDKLSVQVHPDNDYALKYENELGKTEMWYVVDAADDASLIYGVHQGISKGKFIESIHQNNIESTLRKVYVKPGDVLFIPAGVIHAIGEGIVLAEIQQNSDTTYRVYDWNRVGLDGKPRQLHIDQAIDVISFENYTDEPIITGLDIQGEGYRRTIYACCDYFTTEKLDLQERYTDTFNGNRFEIFMCIDGNFQIHYGRNEVENFIKGETALIPAGIGNFSIKGKGQVIRTYMTNPLEMIQMLYDMGYEQNEICEISGLEEYIHLNNKAD